MINGIWDDITSEIKSGVDYLENLRQEAASKVADTAEGLSSSWTNAVNKFKAASNDFQNRYDQLIGLQSVVATSPQLASEYSDVMSRGNTLKNSILSMLNGIASIYAQVTGSSTAPASSLNELGVIPAIPIALSVAAIAGATALIVKWISDADIVIQKAKIIQSTNDSINQTVATLKARGASPQQIQTTVQAMQQTANVALNDVGKGSLTDTMKTVAKIAVAGVGIYAAAKFFFGSKNAAG